MDTVFYPQGAEKPHSFHKFIAELVGAKLSRSKLDLLKAKNILSEGLLPPPALAKFIGRKRLVSLTADTWLYHYVTGKLNWKGRLFTKIALRAADLFIAVGDLDVKFLKKFEFDNYIKVYPFIKKQEENLLEQLKPELKGNNILTIALHGERYDVYKRKGLDILESIAKDMPNFHFNVIGTSLKSKIDNLHYLGWVKAKDKAQLIENSLLSLAPSRFDSFSVAALECMRAGLPIITTPNMGVSKFNIPEFVASNREELKRKIIRFSKLSENEKLKYSEGFRDISYKFAREKFIEDLIYKWKKAGPWELCK